MRMSQIDTYGRALLFVVATITCRVGMGSSNNEIRNIQREAFISDFSAKNGPAIDSSTLDIQSLQKGLDKRAAGSASQLKVLGGSSDGGGNAVGQELFDFYENHGTVELSVTDLISLEPMTIQILLGLNKAVPAIENMSSGGFGEILINSLGSKKIYLESKKIADATCVNQSMVSTDQQQVVACQSDLEVRFNVRWLKGASVENRAGLFMHEMLLAWARSLKIQDSKEILEQKVRIVNREIFNKNIQNDMLSSLLKKYFGVRAFSSIIFEKVKKLTSKINKFESLHPEVSNNDTVKLIFDGIKKGALSFEVCKYLVESWSSDLDKNIYRTLEQSHLNDVDEMCVAE